MNTEQKFREAFRKLMSIVKIHSRATGNNFAWAEMEEAEQALAEQVQGELDAYGYAKELATSIWEKNYKTRAPNWKPLDGLMGVLAQIDNMTCGLSRQPAPDVELVDLLRKAESAMTWEFGGEPCGLQTALADVRAFLAKHEKQEPN